MDFAGSTKHPFRFWPVFLALCVISLPLAYVTILLDRDEKPLSGFALTVGMAAGAATAALGAWLMQLAMPTRVSAQGIRGYNILNLPRAIAWDEIASVHQRKTLGLRWLRIDSTRGGLSVWQPLFLVEPERFRESVLEHVGEDHVLVASLP